MASRSLPEEVFRFSVVRNPRAVASGKLNDSVVHIVPDDAGDDYRYFKTLRTLREQGASRRSILATAERLQAMPDFQAAIEGLTTPVSRFSEQLQRSPQWRSADVRALIVAVFGRSADKVAADADFRRDEVVVADSLVLASVTAPKVPGLRTRLMQYRRAIALIRRVAELATESAAEAMQLLGATLVLPAAIFPLPDENEARRKKSLEAYAQRKAALDKQRARAQKLLDEIAHNSEVADELSGTLSTHLFEMLHEPALARSAEGSVSARSSVSMLPAAKVAKLSGTSKRVLADLKIPESAVDVPFVVDKLEKSSAKLSQELMARFRDVLVDVGWFFLPSCGECKPVILPEPKPENDFSPDTRGKVELVGIQDLLIVRQALREYTVGEIAHIENVLKGELKNRTHRKLDRSEQTTVEEVEKEQEVENELQTTDKYELQVEASKVIHADKSVEAGVTVTASYGSVNIEAHGNYATSDSTTESRNSASTFARDVVSRSQQRIRERVFSRRTRTQIAEVEVTNRHKIDNSDGPDHVTGVYRWLDKVYEAQIVNYGKRTMLEFMVPEPAAFYKYALANKSTRAPSVPRPEQPGFCRNGVFHPLTPADLQPENYLCFVGKYNVKNVSAPTPRYRIVADILKYKIDNTQGAAVSFAEANDAFKLPEGYVPKGIRYVISGGNSHAKTTEPRDIILAVVAIGDTRVFRYYKSELGVSGWPAKEQVIEWGNQLSATEINDGSYRIGEVQGEFPLTASTAGTGDADVVKVSLTGHTSLPMSVSVHYWVLCERSRTKLEQWQLDTFNAIMSTYENQKADYDDALKNQQEADAEELQGRNPLLNRNIEKQELKKFSLSLLTGQQYDSFNAMEQDYHTGIPQIALEDAASEGKFVRFFEQALEWRNMTYLFYPYFWGNKKKWAETLMTDDPDPLFQQFLQAGFARVWVPVRPGFEQVMVNYIECGGEPWTEKDAPIVGDPDAGSAPTIALIDEIKEQLGAEFVQRSGTIRVRKGDSVVTGSGTDFRADDKDREILIALDTYRIDRVDEGAQKISLRIPYAGDDADAVGFGIGVKYVGEPWLVQVPTTLVHLSAKDPITD